MTLPVYVSFGRTVLAYALVMSQEIFAAIVRAAERAGTDRDIGALPEGYQMLLGPAFIDGTDLSTGQWQLDRFSGNSLRPVAGLRLCGRAVSSPVQWSPPS